MFDLNQIRMPKDLMPHTGCNMLIYGVAGSGKTRLSLTAPTPLLWAVENGLLSVQNEPIQTVQLPIQQEINRILAMSDSDRKRVDPFVCVNEFVDWCATQKTHETIIVDSLSELSSLVFSFYGARETNTQRAYGLMAERLLQWAKKLYYAPCNVVFICKETQVNKGTDDNPKYVAVPSIVGQKTYSEISHLIDVILRIQVKMFPANGKMQEFNVFSSKEHVNYHARDRSGKLGEFELVDNGLTYIINKLKGSV